MKGIMYKGIDVSHHNANLNIKKILTEYPDISFMYAKAGEGVTYRDKSYINYQKMAKDHGLLFGAYWFVRKTNLDNIQDTVSILDNVCYRNDLPLMLDYEADDAVGRDHALMALAKAIEDRGIPVGIYASYGVLYDGLADLCGDYALPIWTARYKYSNPIALSDNRLTKYVQEYADREGAVPSNFNQIASKVICKGQTIGLDLNVAWGLDEYVKQSDEKTCTCCKCTNT